MNNVGSDTVAKPKKSRGRPNRRKVQVKNSECAGYSSKETLGAAEETAEISQSDNKHSRIASVEGSCQLASTVQNPMDTHRTAELVEFRVASAPTSSITSGRVGLSATAKEWTPSGFGLVLRQEPHPELPRQPSKQKGRKQRGKRATKNRGETHGNQAADLPVEAHSSSVPEPQFANSWAGRLAASAPSPVTRSGQVAKPDKASKEPVLGPSLERLVPRASSLAASTRGDNSMEARAQDPVGFSPVAAENPDFDPCFTGTDEANAVQTPAAETPASRPTALLKIPEERKERWRTKWWQLVMARECEARERRAMTRHDTRQLEIQQRDLEAQRVLLSGYDDVGIEGRTESEPTAESDGYRGDRDDGGVGLNKSGSSITHANVDAKWHSFLAPCNSTKAVMSAQALSPAPPPHHQGVIHRGGSVGNGSAATARRRRLPAKALFDLVCAGDVVGLTAAIAAGACDWDARLSKEQSDGVASERQLNQDDSTKELNADDSDMGSGTLSSSVFSAFDAWVEEAAEHRSGFTGNAVHLAATVGVASCLDAMLNAFPSAVESKDRTKRRATPLHLAARHGHLAAVKLLLAAGSAPDARDKEAETPLHAAVGGHGTSIGGRGQQTTLCKLLASCTRHPNPRNKERQTPLHLAAMHGNEDVCRALVHGPGGSDAASSVDASGATPLVLAAQHGRASAVALLLLRTPDGGLGSSRSVNDGSDYLSSMPSSGRNGGRSSNNAIAVRSALHECAAAGHATTLRVLLQALSTQLGPSSKLAHHYNIQSSPNSCGNWIDTRDPWPFNQRQGDPPLTLALRHGHGACVQLLLEHGASFASATNQRGQSPLAVAAALGAKDEGTALRLLLHHCADSPPSAVRGLRGSAGAAAVEAALQAGAVSNAAALLLRGAPLCHGAQFAAGLGQHDTDNMRPYWPPSNRYEDAFNKSRHLGTENHSNMATTTSAPAWPSWPPARAATVARLFASAQGRSAQVARDWALAFDAAQDDADSEVAVVEMAMIEASAASSGATASLKSPSFYAACRRHLPPIVPTASSCYADVRLVFWNASAHSGACPEVLLAHAPLLMARSEYFRASLTNAAGSKETIVNSDNSSNSDNSQQMTGFDMHFQPAAGDPSADTMRNVLQFLYTGDLTHTDGEDSTDNEDDDSCDDNGDLDERSSDNYSENGLDVDQHLDVSDAVVRAEDASTTLGDTQGIQASSSPSGLSLSYKPLRHLSLNELADLLMAAHQLLLLRLQRICEHAIGRRLSARTLPLAVHLCSFLDGDCSSNENVSQDLNFDGDNRAASSMSDLHWFVQSFVRRHPDLVQLPFPKDLPNVSYSKVDVHPKLDADPASTATTAATSIRTTAEVEGILTQVSTAESDDRGAEDIATTTKSHLVKLPPYFQLTGGQAQCGRQEVLLASAAYLNQMPLWQPSSSREIEDEIRSNGPLEGTATSLPSSSHVPFAALQLNWKLFQLSSEGPHILASPYALPVTANASLECTPPLSSVTLVAAAEDPDCGALGESERRQVLSRLKNFLTISFDDGPDTIDGEEAQRKMVLAAEEDGQVEETTALHDHRDLCRALPGANLLAYDLWKLWSRLDQAASSTPLPAALQQEPGAYDVQVVAADGGRLWAHRAVLAARSHALAASLRFAGARAVQSDESCGAAWEIKLDLSTEAARMFLGWLYGAKLSDATVELATTATKDMGIIGDVEQSTQEESKYKDKCDAFASILMELCFVAEELLLPQLKFDAAAALTSHIHIGPSASNRCDENQDKKQDYYACALLSPPLEQMGHYLPLLSPHTAAPALQLAVVLGLQNLRVTAGRMLIERLDEVRQSLIDDTDSETKVEHCLKEFIEMALIPLQTNAETSHSDNF